MFGRGLQAEKSQFLMKRGRLFEERTLGTVRKTTVSSKKWQLKISLKHALKPGSPEVRKSPVNTNNGAGLICKLV